MFSFECFAIKLYIQAIRKMSIPNGLFKSKSSGATDLHHTGSCHATEHGGSTHMRTISLGDKVAGHPLLWRSSHASTNCPYNAVDGRKILKWVAVHDQKIRTLADLHGSCLAVDS